MKLLLALLLVLPTLANAAPWTYRVDTGTSTLTSSFGAAQLTGPRQITSVQIDNGTVGEIEVNCSNGVTPSSLSANSMYVGASTTLSTPESSSLGSVCFVRSVSGNLSGGVIRIIAWGF